MSDNRTTCLTCGERYDCTKQGKTRRAKNYCSKACADAGDDNTQTKPSKMHNMNELIGKIRLWGEQRYITGPEGRATADTQFEKLMEEVDEIRDGLQSGIQEAVVDGIGDTAVVLILLAELIGVPFEDCLQSAYNVIKNRTGRMIDGQFVKDSNQ